MVSNKKEKMKECIVPENGRKEGKEKSSIMEAIKEFIQSHPWMVTAGVALVLAFGVAGWWKSRRQKTSSVTEIPKPRQVPKVSAQELFVKKCELEQKMAGITGGTTGMFMLLDMIRGSEKEGKGADQYRKRYRDKKEKLRVYMAEYRELLKQAASLPEEEQGRFVPHAGIQRYQELLDTEV